MELYSAISDVKCTGGNKQKPPYAGLASDVFPEVQKPLMANSSDLGVSTRNAQLGSRPNITSHWYALRTTYNREKKANEFFIAHNIETFYPTLKKVKLINGKKVTLEVSRIPNVFFAYGTEEEMKTFVYDNVNLPFLRFYYQRTRLGNKIIKTPLIVPDSQINSLKIICASDADDIITSTEEIVRFKEGQLVRIIDGKFKGVVGIIARYQSQQRVGIIIDGLLTVCTAYVPSAFLEVIK